MIREIENFDREVLFNYYHERENPFIILTIKLDVTHVVEYCKEHANFYATLGYVITKTANQIENFKYRYKDDKFYYCEKISSNYTEMLSDGNVAFFGVPIIEDFDEYIEAFKKNKQKLLNTGEYNTSDELNEIWLSCVPWYSYTSLIPPFDKTITIPQFIWDKYVLENGRYHVHLMIMVHHGLADGIHIGKFIATLEENIDKFGKDKEGI